MDLRMASSISKTGVIPVLLLKTKSTPTDAYEDLFSSYTSSQNDTFSPIFVPVLLHRFEEAGLEYLRSLLRSKAISADEGKPYGGMIFTSQRAVEALSRIVNEHSGEEPSWPHLQDVPLYSVGPATTRSLRAIPQDPPLQIFGEHTGNGEVLAQYMLDHYRQWYSQKELLPPLLFPVGEQRRDIIPKTLMDPNLPKNRRIQVKEEVIYGTGVMESFPEHFASCLDQSVDAPERWVVVFSPTGCDSLLRGLGLLDESTGKAYGGAIRDGKTFVATIGPTTQAFFRTAFDFEPDVCAEQPAPEGILQAILDYKRRKESKYLV